MSTTSTQSQSQAPATQSAQATSTASAGPATSNSATQEAAGLTSEVPPTTVEGGLLEALAAVGSCANVVLDALPVDQAIGLASMATGLEAVREWLAAQSLADVLLCPSDVIRVVLDEFMPEGSFIEFGAGAGASVGLGPNAEAGGEASVRFQTTGAGGSLTVDGAVEGSAGAAVPLYSAEEANGETVGIWAAMGVEAGASVTARWDVSDKEFAKLPFFGDLAMLGDAVLTGEAPVSLNEWLEPITCMVPDALDATAEGGFFADAGASGFTGEAGVEGGAAAISEVCGVDTAALASLLAGQLQLAGAAGLGFSAGYDSGEGFLRMGLEFAGVATAEFDSEGEQEATMTCFVEARFPMPTAETGAISATDLLAQSRFIHQAGGSDGEGNGSSERQEFHSLGDLIAFLDQGSPAEGEVAVGDLVSGKTHQLDDPHAVPDLLPEEFTGTSWNGLAASVEESVEADVDLAIPEEVLELGLVPYDARDAESARDAQRTILRAFLGETAAPDGVDLGELPVEVRKAAVTMQTAAAVGGGTDILTNGGKASMQAKAGRTVDLAGSIEASDLARLLSA